MCEPYRKLYVHAQNSLEASLDEEQVNMHTPSPVWKLRDLPPADWTNKWPTLVTVHCQHYNYVCVQLSHVYQPCMFLYNTVIPQKYNMTTHTMNWWKWNMWFLHNIILDYNYIIIHVPIVHTDFNLLSMCYVLSKLVLLVDWGHTYWRQICNGSWTVCLAKLRTTVADGI